jgi:hypothetical protein
MRRFGYDSDYIASNEKQQDVRCGVLMAVNMKLMVFYSEDGNSKFL